MKGYTIIILAVAAASALGAMRVRTTLTQSRAFGSEWAQSRLAVIKTGGSAEDGFHLVQPGGLKLTAHDLELIRTDSRLAEAAYPDLDYETLHFGRWFGFEDGVPRSAGHGPFKRSRV